MGRIRPIFAAIAIGLGVSPAQVTVQASEYSQPVPEPAPDERAGSPSRTDFSFALTNFLGVATAGDGDRSPRFGGRMDAFITIDGRDMGLWDGLSISIRPEFVYGESVNRIGIGEFLPINTAMAFPSANREDFDLSLSVTQRLGNASLTLGKINMLDNAARTPIVGGGGREGFQHLQLAAPITFKTPPTIFGGLLNIPTDRAVFTLGIWDPTSAVNATGFENPFSKGVNGMVSGTIPVTIGGMRGFQGLTISGTTARNLDLDDIPDIILPPAGEAVIRTKRGGWHVRYSFQQFLWQDAGDPRRGFGLFGQFNIWDGNPTLGQWSMNIGLAGSPPIASRPGDRFGIGYFRFEPSGTLVRGLAPIIELRPEQGTEIFYTFAFGERFLLTANTQLIAPAPRANATALVFGLRSQFRF